MTQSVPILETILHPPLGALQRELIAGLFSGAGSLTRPAAVLPPFQHVNAYGLTWSFTTVPAGFGRETGVVDILDRRMLQVATVHDDRSGHSIISEYHDFRVEGIYWLWDNPGPTEILYSIEPGVEITFFWLIVNVPF